jgi:hypothetical protein
LKGWGFSRADNACEINAASATKGRLDEMGIPRSNSGAEAKPQAFGKEVVILAGRQWREAEDSTPENFAIRKVSS